MDARKYAEACFAWQQATFFRRKLFERVGGFNPDNPVTWDGELTLGMVLAGARIGYTNRILGHFPIYAESITGSGRLADIQGTQYERWSLPYRCGRCGPAWKDWNTNTTSSGTLGAFSESVQCEFQYFRRVGGGDA